MQHVVIGAGPAGVVAGGGSPVGASDLLVTLKDLWRSSREEEAWVCLGRTSRVAKCPWGT